MDGTTRKLCEDDIVGKKENVAVVRIDLVLGVLNHVGGGNV